ncbi:non-hydrolyzing UDP-N-acetylglucosamine 2-epimerase [Flavobacterium sp. XGLA_31]|uniref:non-hydrolyzing UDP-N-acetylglucosamine 2-epimerase n=1 Tax=Flavobacterium sp. XGLA_31 TaxID=3447666 RepID=UPI003F3042C6
MISQTKKVLICFGTRPEAIKMAPLFHELKGNPNFEVKLCVTAQHRKMLDQVLQFFEIVPDYDLNLMKENQTLNSLSATILAGMDAVLVAEKPDVVLVHGDTTTSSMVALAAFHRNIKIGHVEAGLRTYNKKAPFPEEINRQITGRIADFHFAPTLLAKNNLLQEGIDNEDIAVTGNTIIDALLWTQKKLDGGFTNRQIEDFKFLQNKKFILVTGHRRESFGQGFIDFCEALKTIVKEQNCHVVFPVHLNPNVQKPVNELLGNDDNIHLLEPVDYPVMVWLMKNCSLIISDSGGIQEEAPTFKKHILVTREVSERPEGIQEGFSTLVGTNKTLIIQKAKEYLGKGFEPTNQNPYGDGNACKAIVKYLLHSQV